MKKPIAAILLTICIASCSNNEPAVSELKKDHSVEVTFETKPLGDSTVLMITQQNVYLKGKLVKTVLRTDTLPAPGDTLETVQVDDYEQMVRIPKKYEFFVTVK